MDFWGLPVAPGKRYEKLVTFPFHVSTAVLDTRTDGDTKIVPVMLEIDGKEIQIATLGKKQGILQAKINLDIDSATTVAFCNPGKQSVHFTGYYLPINSGKLKGRPWHKKGKSAKKRPNTAKYKCSVNVINHEGVKVQGRKLPRPPLKLGKKGGLYKPVHLKYWTILNYDPKRWLRRKAQANIRPFIERLVRRGRKLGMKLDTALLQTSRKGLNIGLIAGVLVEMEKYHPEHKFLLVIMEGEPMYEAYGKYRAILHSFMVHYITKLQETRDAMKNCEIDRLMASINSKNGGIAVGIDWNDMKPVSQVMLAGTLVVGGALCKNYVDQDVTIGKVAAMVGVLDSTKAEEHATFVRIQQYISIIQHMQLNIKLLIQEYYKVNKMKPKCIMMYREQVSHSKQSKVAEAELKAIRAACAEMDKEYNPAIIYIFVNTLHETKLFMEDDSTKKPPVGTVIDSIITSDKYQEFYLCNGDRILPTQYLVMENSANVAMEHLEILTYTWLFLHGQGIHMALIPGPLLQAKLAASYMSNIVTHYYDMHAKDNEQEYVDYNRISRMDQENPLFRTLYYL